jgi:hypothetical protein
MIERFSDWRKNFYGIFHFSIHPEALISHTELIKNSRQRKSKLFRNPYQTQSGKVFLCKFKLVLIIEKY